MFNAYDDILLDDLFNGADDGVTCDDSLDCGRGFQNNDGGHGCVDYDSDGHKVDHDYRW
ncbi:MAG: hypothetical protein GY880_29915 [Planctomycetaceae bacterium]|nr:hypothetical protein [Planctomycetaceae bacterium]